MVDIDFNNPNLTYIPAHTKVGADIHVAGDLLVEGEVTGSVEAAGFCIVAGSLDGPLQALGVKIMPGGRVRGDVVAQQMLVVYPGGRLDGDVRGRQVDIRSRMTGSVTVQGRLTVGAGALVQGDVVAAALTVDPTGGITGNVQLLARLHGPDTTDEITDAI